MSRNGAPQRCPAPAPASAFQRAREPAPDPTAAQAYLRQADERLRAFVEHHPFVALGAALGAGFLAGRALNRWWR